MTRRETLVRILSVAVTLAVAVGGVQLMRFGARTAVSRFGFGGEADYREPPPDQRPVAKIHDLTKLVPETLANNIAGLALQSIGKTLDAPIDLAIRQDEQVATAQGWKRFEMPLAYELARDLVGEHLYRLPTGDIVRRTYFEIRGNRTRREELVIPAGRYEPPAAGTTFDSLVRGAAPALREKLPVVLEEVIVGDVFQTQLLRRGTGAALHVTALSTADVVPVRARVAMTFVRAGWTCESKDELVYRRQNLMAFANVLPRGDGEGALVVYRFSDDEALEKTEPVS